MSIQKFFKEAMQWGLSGGPSLAGIATAAKYPYPRAWYFAGDSLTFGTGAVLPWTMTKMATDFCGSASMKLTSVNGGVGGTKLPQIAADLISKIATYDAFVMWGGTNDSDNNYPLERSAEAIMQAATACRVAGKPLVVITPPNFYGATFGVTPNTTNAAAIRSWILANQYSVGFIAVDIWPSINDGTGMPAAAYQYGDGVHLNQEAYAVVAKLIATAAGKFFGTNLVRDAAISNLCSNPGNSGISGAPTGSSVVGATGTASTWVKSTISDTTGVLVSGNKWLNIVADATAGVGVLTLAFSGSSITAGDTISARAKLAITDLNGTTLAQIRTNSGYIDFGVGKAGIIQGGVFLSGCGQNEVDYRIAASSTATHTPLLIISLAAGQKVNVQIGDIGLFDMTANAMA